MTNALAALAALVNAAPHHLERLRVEPAEAVASVDAAKFDNRPAWDNRGGFDSRPSWDNWNKKK